MTAITMCAHARHGVLGDAKAVSNRLRGSEFLGTTMTTPEDTLDERVSVDLSTPVPPLAQIRQWLATVLADLTEDLLQDLLLICTELVSNAYDHASTPRRLRVQRSRERDVLLIEVDDGSPESLPTPGTSRLGSFRGRGLIMVDTLSQRRWGTRRGVDCKTVWAELPLS
ncbi:ATP-binding protein [Saccharothrix sp. HUAS TT1]|uniref:ATP-binding protein n=1 Tax=unclassified Saccharothrix TaxID=2593673 RepID=UPI00345B737F